MTARLTEADIAAIERRVGVYGYQNDADFQKLLAEVRALRDERNALQRRLDAAMRVVEAGREWKRVRAVLSAEHPRTFPTNRNLTTVQFAFDAAIASLDGPPSDPAAAASILEQAGDELEAAGVVCNKIEVARQLLSSAANKGPWHQSRWEPRSVTPDVTEIEAVVWDAAPEEL